MARTASRRPKKSPVPVLVGDEKFLSVNTYARTRGVHRRTIARWTPNGFPVLKVGGKCLIDPVAGDEWIISHASRKGPRSLEPGHARVATR